MRIALFADIHANREALQACLAHAEQQNVDRYSFLGDLLGYGADPEWVLETVIRYQERGALVVLGNHDAAILSKRNDHFMREEARAAIIWTRSRLTPFHLKFLAGLAPIIEDTALIYVHANPWAPKDWEYIMDTFSAAKGLAATHNSCQCIFVGHFHHNTLYHQSITGKIKPFFPTAGVIIPLSRQRRWLAVIGSVGQPRDGNPAACYAIYDISRATIIYHRVPFNVEATIAKIRAAGLPEWNATRLGIGA